MRRNMAQGGSQGDRNELNYSPFVFSVSFDSLAPARLTLRANLRLFHLKSPAFSIVVNLLADAPPPKDYCFTK